MSEKSNISSNNKRIAKNTAYLYVRMLIMTVVGLFTSRIVLDALGKADYGIFNVVGGMIVLFSFFNTTLTSATQRFLNFYLGKNDQEGTQRVFCMSMNIYIFLSILIIVLAETVGLWFLVNYLSIPEDRMWAAHWVYQLAILQFVINTIRIPYNATIIAYEKMDFFAYVSIFDAIIKLIAVYLLYITLYDRLVTYSLLHTITCLLTLIIHKIYCTRKFKITRFKKLWDKSLFKDIYHYSSWTILDAIAIVFSKQGMNIILNIFYGVTLNAAAGVANLVSSHVYAFVSNFQTAFQPQIIQTYAANKISEFHSLISRSCKISYFLFFVLLLPLAFTLDKILSIWLVEVPKYTLEFCLLILISQALESIKVPLDISVNATGRIKILKIGSFILRSLTLPLAYLGLWMGMIPYSIWHGCLLSDVIQIIFLCYVVNKTHGFPLLRFARETLLPISVVTVLSLPVPYLLRNTIEGFWWNFLTVGIVALFITATLIWFIGISLKERKIIIGMIAIKFHLKR